GYGRGHRQRFEADELRFIGGVRHGRTLGSPVAIEIGNSEWTRSDKWHAEMSAAPGETAAPLTTPRPGHADLAGVQKYGFTDVRNVLERASARETAARVAAGTLARLLLAELGITIASHVFRVGNAGTDDPSTISFEQAVAIPESSELHCANPEHERAMIAAIDAAREAGDTLGGAFEVIARGVPPGLGSYTQWDAKLDGRIGQALLSIHAIKAVGVGAGPAVASRPGSAVHDEILPGASEIGLIRPTNRAGGLEGGVTNGEDIRVSGYMKPISTLMKPLRSVDLATGDESPAAIERSDVCAISAAAVVAEAGLAWVLAAAMLEKFGGDTMRDLTAAHAAYLERVGARLPRRA
nr:chorismate synthase [Acidobacteriota bacterium]